MVDEPAVDDLSQQVLEFVAQECGVSKQNITADTRLVEDLGIVGDDAFELFEAYAKQFSIEPGSFIFEDYFPTEGFDLAGLLASFFRKSKPLKTVTIGMLIASARAKRWITRNS